MATGLLVVITLQDHESGLLKPVGTEFMTFVTPEAAKKELDKTIAKLEPKGFFVDGVIMDNVII